MDKKQDEPMIIITQERYEKVIREMIDWGIKIGRTQSLQDEPIKKVRGVEVK